jgi:hypothetical protein
MRRGRGGTNFDLVELMFSQFSQFTPSEYRELYVERLPLLLLRSAIEKRPFLGPLANDVLGALCAGDSSHAANPELYPHLLALQSADERSSAEGHVDALRIQLGMIAPQPGATGARRFVRLRRPEPTVLERRGKAMAEIAGVVCPVPELPTLLVYRPYPLLFDDIVNGHYHGRGKRLELHHLARLVSAALHELKDYSKELWASVAETVRTIAFTSDSVSVTRSYSPRLSFLGGIFCAVCRPPLLVESVLHEHYHCRLWTWWLVEPPADLPGDEMQIISPLTRRRRPASTMLHALLINASLIDYYGFALSGQLRPAERRCCEGRLRKLRMGAVALVDILHAELKGRPHCARYISVLSDIVLGSLRDESGTI